MAHKTKLSGNIVKEYLTKFPSLPSLTLAKKIYNENKLQFSNIESVRSHVRLYRGKQGDENRKDLKNHSFLNQKIEFKMPESYAETFEPYEIKQSNILCLSDLHFPYQHNKAVQLAINYGKEREVNTILLNGDLIDFATISRHEKDWRHRSVSVEFEAVREFLYELKNHFHKAKIIFKEGNHDERWEKWLFLKAPEIFDDQEFKLETRLRLGDLQIDIVKDKLPVKIGKLNVLHGHELQGGGGVNPARATFLKTIDNVLIGHCHRTSTHLEKTFGDRVIGVNSTGCLCGMYPMFARVNKWNLGFAQIEHNIKTGDYVVNNKIIIDNKVF
jgi:predicted phosphodiesterase